MIATMSRKTFTKALNFRTTPRAQRAVADVVHRVKGIESLTWQGGIVTQEAVVNASWLWLADQPDSTLAAILSEYLPKLERTLSEGPATTPNPQRQGVADLSRTILDSPPKAKRDRKGAEPKNAPVGRSRKL